MIFIDSHIYLTSLNITELNKRKTPNHILLIDDFAKVNVGRPGIIHILITSYLKWLMHTHHSDTLILHLQGRPLSLR